VTFATGPETFSTLAGELADRFSTGYRKAWSDHDFGDYAQRAFAFQFEHNTAYRAFCTRRGVTPTQLDHWTRVPAVPTSAFKHLPLVSGTPDEVDVVFRTSGTTRGAQLRGEHRVRSLELYRAAAMPNLALHLFADDPGRVTIFSLVPSPDLAPESSLSRMMAFAVEAWGAPESGFFTHPERGVDIDRFASALHGAAERGDRVWVAGTAFAFVHWIDASASGQAPRVVLPAGSRVMETGGFKGRSREVSRAELYQGIEQALGVPERLIINEYGMTEMLSQFYEPNIAQGVELDLDARFHQGPPWVRTQVLDPQTLAPVAEGEPGLLCHFDLANLGSVCAILTEDLGVAVESGFRLLGRTPGAEPRGCSLALEDLLR
jgi:hypothetical protein